MPEISTKPYLLRAIYEWCTDNGYTPYVAVLVDGATKVPMEHVKDGEIVLNISFTATNALRMDNDVIHFQARFNGVARDIIIPVGNVLAIYARENGQGMAFEATPASESDHDQHVSSDKVPPAGPILTAVPDSGAGARSESRSESRPESAPGLQADPQPAALSDDPPDDPPEPPKKVGRPNLTRVK